MKYEILYDFWPDYKLMKEALPEQPLGKSVRSHGDIAEGDPEFRILMSRCPYWLWFFNHLHSLDFWLPFLDNWDISGIEPFNSHYIEGRQGEHDHTGTDPFFYARMDIGYGYPGYGIVNGGKGNHIDRSNRVLSALWYFTDQSEIDGGEFCVTNKDGDVLEKIELRENMAIFNVQDADGWHMVNPLNSGKRIGVYMALSCSEDFWDRS